MSCFFGIIFGVFSLGLTAPNIKAVTEGRAAGKMAFDIIDRVPTILSNDPKAKKIGKDMRGGIEFRDVKFSYPSRPQDQVLKGLSCVFQENKTTAIVGASGSGKSTCVQLMERFYDPLGGEILIDGHNLKSINLRDFRQNVGYVGQEPVLFNQSIKANILYGNPEATDAEVREALKSANASKFVDKLIMGENTLVGSSGG